MVPGALQGETREPPVTNPASPIAAAMPMEARSQPELPADGGWRFEPKWDGFRCLALRDEAGVELRAKSGKPLTRYFP